MKHKPYQILACCLIVFGVILASVNMMAPTRLMENPLVDLNDSRIDPFLPLMPRTGDLTSIKKYGYLRVLFTDENFDVIETDLLQKFAHHHGLNIIYISIDTLSRGQNLLNSGLADILLGSARYSKRISKILPFNTGKNKAVSWSIRSKNLELKNALDHHLNYFLISENLPENYREDLSSLKKRKLLRVVTQPDPYNYFLKKGMPAGFEYELLQRFAKQQGLWLEIIIAGDEKGMLKWIKEGKADLATITFNDHEPEIVSTFPFFPAKNFIITRKSETEFNGLYDINGKELVLHDRKYQQHGIKYLMDKGLTLSTVEIDSTHSLSALLQNIVDQQYNIAMVPARDYIKNNKFHDQLKVIAADNDKPLHRWAFSKNNLELQAAIDKFLRKEFQGEFFNIVYERYYPKQHIPPQLVISPYDLIVKKYAEKYQFDWRLILAQMYQESKFEPNATSASGAKGLMQIMPETAQELNFTDVDDPEMAIKAGVKYMKRLRDKYNNVLSRTERNWFALASYNAGYERIQDARMFAKKLGLDPDRWFDHVENAMQQLAKPENKKHTRYGYCRCGQTVVYLRSIKKLYNSYIQLSNPQIIAAHERILFTDNK